VSGNVERFMGRRTALAFLVLLVIASWSSEAKVQPVPNSGSRDESPANRALFLINLYRTLAHVAPISLEPTLSQECSEHARYMLLNSDKRAMMGMNAHKQDSTLPGASSGGEKCAETADLFPNIPDIDSAITGFMATIYHRRPILSPYLDKIGVGYAIRPGGGLAAAVMFVDRSKPDVKWPVAYPSDGQIDVPLRFGSEVPNPIPNDNRLGGFPITLQFPPFDKVSDVKVELVDEDGREIPIWVSSPEFPATKAFGQFGIVSAIAKTPFKPRSRYTTHVTANWQPAFGGAKAYQHIDRTWSFTTMAPPSM
jgi:uncharacterized protein YkwD